VAAPRWNERWRASLDCARSSESGRAIDC
jgi:hypothetical protein